MATKREMKAITLRNEPLETALRIFRLAEQHKLRVKLVRIVLDKPKDSSNR